METATKIYILIGVFFLLTLRSCACSSEPAASTDATPRTTTASIVDERSDAPTAPAVQNVSADARPRLQIAKAQLLKHVKENGLSYHITTDVDPRSGVEMTTFAFRDIAVVKVLSVGDAVTEAWCEFDAFYPEPTGATRGYFSGAMMLELADPAGIDSPAKTPSGKLDGYKKFRLQVQRLIDLANDGGPTPHPPELHYRSTTSDSVFVSVESGDVRVRIVPRSLVARSK